LNGLERISLLELINDVCQVRKLDIKSKNLQIKCNNSPLYIHTNSKQLSVVLDNVLSNAIKYSPQNGHIEISYSSNDEELTLHIIDQGPGIPLSLSHKVFDAFYQGQAPENSLIKGSGLGLTIVKELLLRLNGSIEITPAEKIIAVNKSGACITITLPHTPKDNNL
jgi:two-component system sensor histidine kinase GlrK